MTMIVLFAKFGFDRSRGNCQPADPWKTDSPILEAHIARAALQSAAMLCGNWEDFILENQTRRYK